MVFLTLSAQYESYIESHYYLVDCAAGNLGCFIFYCLARTKQRCIRSGSTGNADWFASKNAILIVEFANQSRETGLSIVKAAQKAAEERFPVLF